MATSSSSSSGTTTTRKAGAFDIRVFIGSLIGIYGLVLVLVGLFGTSDAQLAKSDDLNINLWAGLGMVAVAGGFFLWARLRPVIVPVDPDAPPADASHGH
jgi:hypothetical protein